MLHPESSTAEYDIDWDYALSYYADARWELERSIENMRTYVTDFDSAADATAFVFELIGQVEEYIAKQ